jgi:hypothetical protein
VLGVCLDAWSTSSFYTFFTFIPGPLPRFFFSSCPLLLYFPSLGLQSSPTRSFLLYHFILDSYWKPCFSSVGLSLANTLRDLKQLHPSAPEYHILFFQDPFLYHLHSFVNQLLLAPCFGSTYTAQPQAEYQQQKINNIYSTTNYYRQISWDIYYWLTTWVLSTSCRLLLGTPITSTLTASLTACQRSTKHTQTGLCTFTQHYKLLIKNKIILASSYDD